MEAKLEQACGAFEQTLIASLVAPVVRALAGAGETADGGAFGGSATGDPADGQLAESLFPQLVAQALEQAGGLGLRAALARTLAPEA